MSQERIEALKDEIAGAGKHLLIEILLRDADLHEAGDVASVGDNSDELDSIFYFAARDSRQIEIARTFYHGWQDERNHGFVGYYEGIARGGWPRLARYIADRLGADVEITDPVILRNFDYRPGPSLVARIRHMFRSS